MLLLSLSLPALDDNRDVSRTKSISLPSVDLCKRMILSLIPIDRDDVAEVHRSEYLSSRPISFSLSPIKFWVFL